MALFFHNRIFDIRTESFIQAYNRSHVLATAERLWTHTVMLAVNYVKSQSIIFTFVELLFLE